MQSLTILCDYLCYKKHNYPKAENFSKRLIYPQRVRKQKKQRIYPSSAWEGLRLHLLVIPYTLEFFIQELIRLTMG